MANNELPDGIWLGQDCFETDRTFNGNRLYGKTTT